MVWRKFLARLGNKYERTARTGRKRRLLMERMERRELLASDVGTITGVAFIDENNDGSNTGDPPVLVDNSGNLVEPGTAGAQGISVQLFEDTNTDGLFDPNDQLIGTDITDLDGNYRFDQLTAGTYFLQQQNVPQLTTPSAVTVQVTNASGTRTALIDDYSETTQSVTATALSTNTDTATASEAIGGARDIQVTNTAVTGQLTVFVDAGSDTLSIGSLGDAVGTALIQYDGTDGAVTLDAGGLGGVSLAGGTAGDTLDPGAGLVVQTRADASGDDLVITVYTDATNFSTATIPVPQDASTFQETFVRFGDFIVGGGSGADFNDVGAIEASLGLSANNDAFVSIVESIRPEQTTANIANILPLTLGGEIFRDDSASATNNGNRESTEGGVSGVTVELYQLAAESDSVDLGSDAPVASTSTGTNGAYSFAGLDPGHYSVVIPASQFQPGGALFGFANSTGNDPAPDPDDNIDGDDNGTVDVTNAVIGGTITLASNQEPTDDDDSDANTNTTVDFGFYPQTDLSITKTLNESDSEIIAGGTAVFDILVQNTGPLNATNVVVEDIFPSGLVFRGTQNASGSFNTNVNGATVAVSLGSLSAGATATFQFVADIADNQTADLSNTATVTGDQTDIDTSNNSDDAALDLIASDLVLTKTDVTDPVNAGEQLTYQITVTNNGPDEASGVVVTDALPASVTFSGGDVDGDSSLVSFNTATGEVIATVGTLANGASSLVTITVDVATDAGSPLTNNATVTADPNTDPDSSNNTDDETTVVQRAVDIVVDKTATDTAIAGEQLTYTVVVTNNGPSQARGVTAADTLDANFTYVAGSFDAGASSTTLTENGQTLDFDIGVLDSGQSATFTFDVLIDAAASGVITNAVTGATTDNDTDTTNDTDSIDVTVQQQVDLVVTKDVDRTTAVPGQDQLVYTFSISHDTDSSSNASDVVLTDVLPAGVTNAQINAPGATSSGIDNGTVTVRYDTIAQGQSETFTVTVDLDPSTTGTIENSATVTSSATETDPTDNSDEATTTLSPAFDVSVTKTVDDASPGPTETIQYTVDLTNAGPSTATDVVLTDEIPQGLTFVSGTLEGFNGSSDGSTVTFPGIDITPGETVSATLTFSVDVSASGTITNTATIPDLTASGETNATNNSGAVDINVIPLVDLSLSKTVSTDEIQAGNELTYTVTVRNDGPSTARDVEVIDTLPAGVTFVSGTGTGGEALTANNGVVTVDVGDLNSGASVSFTIVVNVPVGTNGDVTNSATVNTSTNEDVTTNNTATATTTVDPMTSSISGVVYIDVNRDGTRDDEEVGVANVQLTLAGTDSLGNPVNITVTTDEDGNYRFDNLSAGTYTVTETQPEGLFDGQESLGTGASAVATNDMFSDIALGADTDAIAFNFAEVAEPLSKRRFLASS